MLNNWVAVFCSDRPGDLTGSHDPLLGLPLAKRFTALHGGRLDVASPPDVGTRIAVTLPASSLRRATVMAKAG